MKHFLSLLGLVLGSNLLSAQVNFQAFPKDLQLYPRDLNTNMANCHIQGTAANGTDTLLFTLTKSDGTETEQALALSDLINNQFDVNFNIQAGLWSYEVKVEKKTATSLILLKKAQNIVAGDVFVIQGQSNAQAVAYNGDANIWQNNFTRSFGTPNPDVLNDETWYIAEGNGYFSPGAVGQWGLRMGSLIQEHLKVPVAIINGADPGKPIEFFQRNDALHTDPTTNYGRLLQRLLNAGVSNQIRGLLYYQGESDGDRALIHKTLFEALHAAWEQDIPNIEGYYIVQVREGCGSPTLQLREYQKDFENYLHHARAVTANGINGHDGCHYSLLGYQTLGEKLYKQISAELYQTPTGAQTNIRVVSASFSNDQNTQITVTTDVPSAVIAQAGSAADFRIEGDGASIIGIQALGNQLILDLDQSVTNPITGLSYGGHSGSDAWILNSDGYGMFTFYNFPIDNYHVVPNFDIPGIMSGSGNCIALDGVDDYVYVGPVLGNSYTKEAWINWTGGSALNNIISGAANTAFWAPNGVLAAGHNGAWGQVSDNVVLTPNQWTHVAVTYDAALEELSLYKNGKLVAQAENVPAHNDPEVYVGSFVGCCTFQGKIDEVRIWDTVRTIAEIRTNMCQKLPDTAPHLTTYLRFDETSGNAAPNTTGAPDGQLRNFQGYGLNQAWKRSGAPIGTKSTYTYTNVTQLGLSNPSGDSLILSTTSVPDFVHLYFVSEVPNVLEPAEGFTVVDNARYFGLFYANQSISHYTLQYHYAANPFAFLQEQNLGLLQRRNNAQSSWTEAAQATLNLNGHSIQTDGTIYQEFILAIRDSIQNPPLAAQLSLAQSILCSGLNDGAVFVTALGGMPPYTYSLNGGAPQATGFFTNLGAGNYSVMVLDQSGNAIATNPVDLQSPDPLAVSLQIVENDVVVNTTGGTAPYTWQSNAPDPNLQNLPNGTYGLTLTDANGCVQTVQFSINIQALSSTPLVITQQILCSGLSIGAINLTANGGQAPYSYSLNGNAPQASGLFTGLPAGDYTVEISDQSGKTITSNMVSLLNPDPLVISIQVSGNSAMSTIEGGTSPYSIETNAPDPDLQNLPNGSYFVKVTDANGCVESEQFTIDFQPLNVSSTIIDYDPCDGLADLVLIAQGGMSPYLFSLNNSAFQSGNTFQDLISGDYLGIVQDAQGQTVEMAAIEIIIPSLFNASANIGSGSILVSPSGGTYPYTFALNGGAVQSDSLFQGLDAGSYTVEVQDAAGCIITLTELLLTSSTQFPGSDLGISISPNPGSGNFTLQSNRMKSGCLASIWDLNGRKVYSFEIPASESVLSTQFDLSEKPDGVYLLRVSNKEEYQNFRLVKIK